MVPLRGWGGNLIKLLCWRRDGLCLSARRLERGRVTGPQASHGSLALTDAGTAVDAAKGHSLADLETSIVLVNLTLKDLLQADAYAGFNPLYLDGAMREAGCWAQRAASSMNCMQPDHRTITTKALQRIAEPIGL